MTLPWGKYKKTIIGLYIDNNLTVHEVKAVMKQDHAFEAHVRTYHSYFTKWGVGKHVHSNRQTIHTSNEGMNSQGYEGAEVRSTASGSSAHEAGGNAGSSYDAYTQHGTYNENAFFQNAPTSTGEPQSAYQQHISQLLGQHDDQSGFGYDETLPYDEQLTLAIPPTENAKVLGSTGSGEGKGKRSSKTKKRRAT